MGFTITTNEKGLALLGDLKFFCPEPLPNRNTEDEDNNKKPN
jgi:hypothetical protein